MSEIRFESEYLDAMAYLDELGVPRSAFPDDPRGFVRDYERTGAVFLTLKGRIRWLADREGLVTIE